MDLEINRLHFGYKERQILKNVSFTAKEGEITAIIGANAVGKSTLLKCIMGVLKARGEITLDGNQRQKMSQQEVARCIGYLTQENASQALLTVFEVILLGRMSSLSLKIPPEELEKVWKIIQDVNIEPIATCMFHQLSGGQRRIVSIAQSIVREPKILLLDEPTSNLDMQNQLEVLELVRDYTQKNGTATVVTLHDLNMAARYADKVIVLKDGAIYKSGTPQEAITEDVVRETYHVEAEITYDRHGIPMVNPIRSIETIN